MKTEERIPEICFHYLDFEDVSSASVNLSQSSTIVLSSVESDRKTVEKGPLSDLGQIVNIAEKHDRFGVGYHPVSRHPSVRRRKKFNPIWFSNTGYQYDLSISMVDGESSSKPIVFCFVVSSLIQVRQLDLYRSPYSLFRRYVMHFVLLIPFSEACE